MMIAAQPIEVGNMRALAGKTYDSIKCRRLYDQLYNELRTDYGFPNAICRSLAELFDRYLKLYLGENLNDGQIRYRAIAADVRPGIKTSEMHLVAVKLTLYSPEDLEYAAESQKQLLTNRIIRLTNEALDQGALLTQADLSILLGESVRTIRRRIKELKEEGIIVPTRGNWMDIGPGISHRAKIVELYIKGYDFTKIKRWTRHSSEAILRYLKEFARVVTLYENNYKAHEIALITEHSKRLVREYIQLYEKYKGQAEYEAILNQIREFYWGGKIQAAITAASRCRRCSAAELERR
jgi:DNA-binding Lrp family transcriptional regulator